MDHRKYMTILKFDEVELARRRAFFELEDKDLERLRSLRPFAERHTEEIVERFYELVLGHASTRKFFADENAVGRVKRLQRDYFLSLFTGQCDLAYVEDRLRIGAAHERIGLAPTWYLGAYRRYLELVIDLLQKDFGPVEAQAAFVSLQKLVYFDMSVAFDTYVASKVEAIERHQMAIRELSTPVIRVFEGVLLLPLVGAVDSYRAAQAMEQILLRVVEAQAKVVLIDIAGVPVVDTKVADSLVKTTAAIRLLGAETILTGISAQVARTIVQLGVNISSMHTLSRLGEGIELALSLVGRRIHAAESQS